MLRALGLLRTHAAVGNSNADDIQAALFKICERFNDEKNAFTDVSAGETPPST